MLEHPLLRDFSPSPQTFGFVQCNSERNTFQCHCVPLVSGSRRERCGYRILRRHRNSEDCMGKTKKYNEAATRVKEILLSTVSPEQFVLTLLEAEPPNVLVSRPSKPFTEASMMMSLTKLADKELVHMIGWAKKIPGKNFNLFFIYFIWCLNGIAL